MPTNSRLTLGQSPAGPCARRPRRHIARLAPWLLHAGLTSIALALLSPLRAGEPTEKASEAEPPRIAATRSTTVDRIAVQHASPRSASPVVDTTLIDTTLAAKKALSTCQERYAKISDYTCILLKRERHDGKLSAQSVMSMKARSRPHSIYMKFSSPNKGREAIYVKGRHNDQVVAHDVGLFKVIAGTVMLDPRGPRAMEGCRHPITEAGIGALIDTIARHWAIELTPGESKVTIHPSMTIGSRPCTMIESIHPTKQPHFLFHKVKLYIDHEYGLPVRFEAYDWPSRPGAPEPLMEEYVYVDLKLNVGLSDRDFDPNNQSYSFGRF
ncbi:MAG: DUF1571 domain-containing protein [Isosphaeraceae bacterium]